MYVLRFLCTYFTDSIRDCYFCSLNIELYAACQSGGLETIKELLPHVPEAVNEFLMEEKNLLMW